MENIKILNYVNDVLKNTPDEWLKKTTHRLDIYNESLAKTEFLDHFENLFNEGNSQASALSELPTAFDYIRLGHPLSCVLEWSLAKLIGLKPSQVISFSSQSMPILAILRKNLLDNINTQIVYKNKLPNNFDADILKSIYGYNFELVKVNKISEVADFNGTSIYISQLEEFNDIELSTNIDFLICLQQSLGSIVFVNSNEAYISEIQHVRRRETIAMTPTDCVTVLNSLINKSSISEHLLNEDNKKAVLNSINKITGANTSALLGSSGLSIQYAILMGLIHDAKEMHKGKDIKIIVPPNCYGGTNDQSRRVAACIDGVEVVDLPVDSGNDMVSSIDKVLSDLAIDDAVPYIIAEIPTNPRVEVPELDKLKEVLCKKRKTKSGDLATEPVFILDQTFCPNVQFLGEGEILSEVKTISYVSGSKFPSGGLCTVGYCVANKKAESLIRKIETHLKLCDNEATGQHIEVLTKQLSSMNKRIQEAYKNTRAFVNHINETLPEAKINFVSQKLAEQGFTPSVFSLDLPTKGNSAEEKEAYKRELNYKLINMMINKIPNESKHCVSYGQLKGCYWTIPATSTQGTTKERDKDYIVRVSMSPDMDLEKHKEVFTEFVNSI